MDSTSSTRWLSCHVRSLLVGCSSDSLDRLNGQGSQQREDGCRGEERRVIVASANGQKDRGNRRSQRLRERVGDVEDAQVLGRFLAALGQYSGGQCQINRQVDTLPDSGDGNGNQEQRERACESDEGKSCRVDDRRNDHEDLAPVRFVGEPAAHVAADHDEDGLHQGRVEDQRAYPGWVLMQMVEQVEDLVAEQGRQAHEDEEATRPVPSKVRIAKRVHPEAAQELADAVGRKLLVAGEPTITQYEDEEQDEDEANS